MGRVTGDGGRVTDAGGTVTGDGGRVIGAGGTGDGVNDGGEMATGSEEKGSGSARAGSDGGGWSRSESHRSRGFCSGRARVSGRESSVVSLGRRSIACGGHPTEREDSAESDSLATRERRCRRRSCAVAPTSGQGWCCVVVTTGSLCVQMGCGRGSSWGPPSPQGSGVAASRPSSRRVSLPSAWPPAFRRVPCPSSLCVVSAS